MLSRLDTRTLQTKMEEKEIVKPQAIEQKFDKLKAAKKERFRPLSEESPMGQRRNSGLFRSIYSRGAAQRQLHRII